MPRRRDWLVEGEYYRGTVYMPEPSAHRSPIEEMFSNTKRLETALLMLYMLNGLVMMMRFSGVDIFTAFQYLGKLAMMSPQAILEKYPQIYYATFYTFFATYIIYPLYHMYEKWRRKTELVVTNPAIEGVLYTVFLVSNIMLFIITKEATLLPILAIIMLSGAFMFNRDVEYMVGKINEEAAKMGASK